MIIDVLVCYPDGTQRTEQREVPDNWFDTPVGGGVPDAPQQENK